MLNLTIKSLLYTVTLLIWVCGEPRHSSQEVKSCSCQTKIKQINSTMKALNLLSGSVTDNKDTKGNMPKEEDISIKVKPVLPWFPLYHIIIFMRIDDWLLICVWVRADPAEINVPSFVWHVLMFPRWIARQANQFRREPLRGRLIKAD